MLTSYILLHLKQQIKTIAHTQTQSHLCSANFDPGKGGLGGATSSSEMFVKLSVGMVLLRISFSRSVRGISHMLYAWEAEDRQKQMEREIRESGEDTGT